MELFGQMIVVFKPQFDCRMESLKHVKPQTRNRLAVYLAMRCWPLPIYELADLYLLGGMPTPLKNMSLS